MEDEKDSDKLIGKKREAPNKKEKKGKKDKKNQKQDKK